MSKKVINLKAVIDFFITVDPIKETQLQTKANKLFSDYNKNKKNKYKLKDFNEANKRDWLNLKNWIDVVLRGSELKSISTSRLALIYQTLTELLRQTYILLTDIHTIMVVLAFTEGQRLLVNIRKPVLTQTLWILLVSLPF